MAKSFLGFTRATTSAHERAGMVLMDLTEARAAEAQRQSQAKALEEKRAAETIAPQLFSLTAGDGEDAAFRRITSPQTLRDLNPVMHDRMQQVCYYLSVTTPFGKRIVEIITTYAVGDVFKVVCTDPAAQDIVDRFWSDEINDMNNRMLAMCNELTSLGEYCTPVAVNPVNGFVRLGYIDPMNIDSIEYGKMATANGDQAIAFPINVVTRREVGDQQNKKLKLVRIDEDPSSESFGYKSGDVFYFAINKASSASRGISELFSLADWIDVFDNMIFDFADKVRFLNAFIWHYTLDGADDPKVDAFQKKVTKNPPRQGGVTVTNEKVKIEAQTPEFHGGDMAAGAEMVKKYGLGGAGLPDWFFGDSGSGNRSTAAEMQGPTGKKLTARQNHLVNCITSIISFVLDQAKLHGALPQSTNTAHTVEVPELMVRDMSNAATALTGATTSIGVAEDRGWVRGETAARCFHLLVGQLGIVIKDSKEEYVAGQQELADRKAQQQNNLFPQDALSAALQQQQQQPAAVVPADNSEASQAADDMVQ